MAPPDGSGTRRPHARKHSRRMAGCRMSRMCARGLHLDLGLHVAARHGAERVRGRCALLRRRSWMARCEYSSALGWLALNAAGADGLTSSPSAAFAAVPSAHATISQSTCITRSAGLVRDGELPWCVPQAERPISLAESISIVRQASNARRHRRARTNEPTDGRALDLTLGAQHECDVPQPVRRLDVCLHCPASHRTQPVVRPDPHARGSPGKPRPRPSVAHLCATAMFMVALL